MTIFSLKSKTDIKYLNKHEKKTNFFSDFKMNQYDKIISACCLTTEKKKSPRDFVFLVKIKNIWHHKNMF